MSYQALYRRYRPRVFGEVIGQGHITTILKNQVKSGRTAHAYLFSGARGTGKTSTAKILARAVNCEAPEDGEPCRKCAACLLKESDNVDIVELDAASNTGVDDMRALLEKAHYTPLRLRMKVYIIDEAHMLSNSACNALLKTLEEPPAHILFILATTEPQRIPATIISRCQRYDFRRFTVDEMVGSMKRVLAEAGAEIEDEGLMAIARSADGGMRDALSLADQCLAFCGNNVTARDVYNVLGGMDQDFMFDMADAILESDAARALRLLNGVIAGGRDINVFTSGLIQHARALLLAKTCGPCSDILDCTEDAMRRYLEQAQKSGVERILRMLNELTKAQNSYKWAPMPRVLFENALVLICRPERDESIDALLDRLERMERMIRPEPRGAADAAVNAPAIAPAAPEVRTCGEDTPPWEDTPVPQAPPEQPSPHADFGGIAQGMPGGRGPNNENAAPAGHNTGEAGDVYARLLETVKQQNMTLYTFLLKSAERGVRDGMLSIAYENELFHRALTKPENQKALEDMLHLSFPGMRLEIRLADKKGGDLAARAAALFGDKLEIED